MASTGPAGPAGPKGDAGATGAAGPKGDTGAPGSAGPQGAKGDTGAVGATGAQGLKGDTGATGPQGAKGDAGAAGATGATGPQGPAGVSPVRSAQVAQTNTAGAVTFPFAPGLFSAPPVIALVVEAAADGRDYNATVTSRSATSCVVRVRRSRTLPAVLGLLSTLAGYDPWEAPGAVTVHLIATPPG